MPPLLAVRSPNDATADDLLWPAVTPDLLIRLEPGEVLRWRGVAEVSEVRRADGRDPTAGLKRVWKLAEPAECLITDRRITYRTNNLQQEAETLSAIGGHPSQPHRGPQTSILAGQVRFQWPVAVTLLSSKRPGESLAAVQFGCVDDEAIVLLMLIMTQRTSGPAPDQVAADVARGVASDIARFRLAALAGELSSDLVHRLTMQRDNPTPAAEDSQARWNTLKWDLPGGLRIGRPPDALARDRARAKRLEDLAEAAQAALERYENHGRERDLEVSLHHGRALLEEAPLDSPDRLPFLNIYAGALAARYDRFGDLSDLTTAINTMREVAKRAELEAPQWRPSALNNLGSLLIERWERGLDEDDLAEGIAVHEAAVEATSNDSPDWPGFASNLGRALRARYPLTNDAADLDRAVKLQEQVVACISSGSSDRAGSLSNLGFALWDRYRANNRQRDLTRAISSYQVALELLPRDAPHRAEVLQALAAASTHLHHQEDRGADLETAVRSWRQACSTAQANSPVTVLQAALSWSEAMANQQDWATVIEACQFGLDAADRLFRVQLAEEHKNLWLEEASGLPARAAYALAKVRQLERAAVTLEGGRAVLLSAALERDHTDLDQLVTLGRADLRERYRQAVAHIAELEPAGREGAALEQAAAIPGEREEVVRAAQAELDAAVASIRTIPGYDAFLTRPGYHEIAAAAGAAPLVYLAVTEIGGLALIVDGRIRATPALAVVWLDELTEAAIESLAEEYFRAYDKQLLGPTGWQHALDSVTRRLWDMVMGPLLAVLPADQVTLVPGGLLGLLPLHAAWREDPTMPTRRRYALDDALITYTPSARALLACTQLAGRSRPDGILTVNDPSLPNSEPEVRAALSWFAHGKQFRKNQATRKVMRAALPRYPVLHFSCHGLAAIDDPLASRLEVTNDGGLSLRDLLQERLPAARLAVLSACETAVPGAHIPDEVISLPTGLVQAGVAGVVGSLWPVGDAITSALMARFYQLWRGQGLEPAQALRQAQQWIRDSTIRAKQLEYPEVDWTGQVSLSPRELRLVGDARVHEHPTNWAAFLYVGV